MDSFAMNFAKNLETKKTDNMAEVEHHGAFGRKEPFCFRMVAAVRSVAMRVFATAKEWSAHTPSS
jgi:hypothetical protein